MNLSELIERLQRLQASQTLDLPTNVVEVGVIETGHNWRTVQVVTESQQDSLSVEGVVERLESFHRTFAGQLDAVRGEVVSELIECRRLMCRRLMHVPGPPDSLPLGPVKPRH